MMIKSLKLLAAVALCILSSGTGCSSRPLDSGTAVSIAYNADFAGETSYGYLILVIEMSIENPGPEPFEVSPSNFLVKVDEYTYIARENQLVTTALPGGVKLNGKLTFHVPPEAALPRIGYTLAYSGPSAAEINWIKLTPTLTAASTLSNPSVGIAYSTELLWLSAPGTQYLKVDPPGRLYLVAEISITNYGYESFNTNPDYFTLMVSHPFLSATAEVEEELIDWRELSIPNSGKYVGSLAFHVPTDMAQSFYQWNYELVYSGVRDYNIQWTKLSVAKCLIDPGETELDAITLGDGQNIKGKLAFIITSELASEGAVYKMQYDLIKTSHNIQWFDQPDSMKDINRNAVAYPLIKITYSTSVVQAPGTGPLYLIVELLIENKGYESFITAPGNFFVEVTYSAGQQ